MGTIYRHHTPNKTVYGILFSGDPPNVAAYDGTGTGPTGSAFNAANWATYARPMPELGSPAAHIGVYTFTFPSGLTTTNVSFFALFYEQVGGSADYAADTFIAGGLLLPVGGDITPWADKAGLQNIQNRLPAALVSGRMDASVGTISSGERTTLAGVIWGFVTRSLTFPQSLFVPASGAYQSPDAAYVIARTGLNNLVEAGAGGQGLTSDELSGIITSMLPGAEAKTALRVTPDLIRSPRLDPYVTQIIKDAVALRAGAMALRRPEVEKATGTNFKTTMDQRSMAEVREGMEEEASALEDLAMQQGQRVKSLVRNT